MSLLLGIDIGTSHIKAVLIHADTGDYVSVIERPTPTLHPREGWSEYDPEALWQVVASCIRECAAGRNVAALAISSMAEAGVPVDAQGNPISSIIAWFDRRSEPQAAQIERIVSPEQIFQITGQKVSPSFGATKLLWLRANQPEIFSTMRAWLPVSTWILYRLCGTAVMDRTIASRTLLFDQRLLDWSPVLLDTLGLPRSILPAVQPSGTAVGRISGQAAQATGLSQQTLCVLGGHDHVCAAYAVGATRPGALVDSSGSANALIATVPSFLDDPALGRNGYACYAHILAGQYLVKGGLKAAGSAVEWLAKMLNSGIAEYAGLEITARSTAGRKKGPLWLPYFLGSGTPLGDRHASATLVGVRIEDTAADLFRGLLEGLALWTRHNVDTMRALTGQPVESLILTGGATRLTLLSSLKAAATGLPVHVPQIPEAAATGAALLAGFGAGIFPTPETARAALSVPTMNITPDLQLAAWYEDLYQAAYLPLVQALAPIYAGLHNEEPAGKTLAAG